MPNYDPTVYLRYEPLTELLRAFAAEYPSHCTLDSLGKTLQGREIWIVTLTNQATGPHDEKPAYWIDGNTHAGEVTGCQACVHTIHHLLTNYDRDPAVTRLLDQQTFYVVPRICADGSEIYLTTPETLRSTPLLYPEPDVPAGLVPEDLNGDGLILQMRVPDPCGNYRASSKDPRLMLAREPDDHGDGTTTYYRLFAEGRFHKYDGFHQKLARKWGLDMNRNYPTNWKPEGEQEGAGPHPLSQPESRAVVEGITARPNIVGIQSYHTFSGIILRPYAGKDDLEMPEHDLEVFKRLGERGTAITGYRCVSIHHGFRYHPKKSLSGGFNDWAFEHRGIFPYTTELWNLAYQAGIEIEDHIQWEMKEAPEDDLVRILAWCDANLDAGTFFTNWTPFSHPELGRIEIGGWHFKRTWQNPPEKLLPEEVEKNMQFTLACARANPRVAIREATEQELGTGEHGPLRHLTLVVQNTGYLPTHGSETAVKAGAVKKPKVRVALPQGVTLVQGQLEREIEPLSGRSQTEPFRNAFWHSGSENSHEVKLEWVVAGAGAVAVEVRFERAGTIRHTFE